MSFFAKNSDYFFARGEWERGKMNFEEFANMVAEMLQRELGDNYTVTVTKVLKNNAIRLTGVVIMEESENISPTIYLEESYRRYRNGVSPQKILGGIVALYKEHAHMADLDMDFFRNFSAVENRIFHKIINYEKNRELLSDMPWFGWHDLAVVFYYAMEETLFGKASIMIHNNHLDMWGQSAEAIYRIAQRNMKRSMPELLLPLRDLLEESLGVSTEGKEIPLYVLTNSEKMFGASALLYSEQIGELADRLKSDLLILPSSVHEVLLLPDDRTQEYEFYRKMVSEVNTTQVDPEEILSFGLYRYTRDKKEIEEIFA